MDNDEIDVTKLKYVLYARKSTDDPQKQVRSIKDQIAECEIKALKDNLHIVKKIKENRSAKKPNQRPEFTQMLKDIKSGKYDAILAWHPDRLSRNMKEGGEIIDMIDEGIIKDLKFVAHHFSNDPSGKMLLGMAFVLSKEYSDRLSKNVKRGIGNNLDEGKSPIPKYGYINEELRYRPDEDNFKLICKAWEMRVNGESIEKITDYLNNQGLHRKVKKSGKKLFITIQKLSRLFKDPFYYGILIQAKEMADLRNMYDFIPAVSEADYNRVQDMAYRKIKPSKPHKNNFYPFRMMIFCHYCGNSMRVAPSTGKTQRYLYARCDNAACFRNSEGNKSKPKEEQISASIRTSKLLDFIYDFLKDGLGLSDKDYESYLKEITAINDERRAELRIELHSKQGVVKRVESELNEKALGITKLEPETTAWKINQQKISELEQTKLTLEGQIEKIKEALEKPEQEKLSLEQFLNLSKNAVTIVKIGDAMVKDIICRLIFANFFVDSTKVTKYSLNEPFATLLKGRTFLLGRGERN